MTNKLSDSWQTPDWLFKELNEEFHFSIDLCATRENKKCPRYFSDYLNNIKGDCVNTIKTFEDILDQIDNTTCFMNPPYSNPKPFIEKAWEDSKYCKIVCLVKCDPSTKWWAVFYDHSIHVPRRGCEIRFFPNRIKFVPPAGFEGKTTGPSFASALLIFDRRGLG